MRLIADAGQRADQIACADIVQGRPLSAADLQRVQQAQERLQRAVRIAEGKL